MKQKNLALPIDNQFVALEDLQAKYFDPSKVSLKRQVNWQSSVTKPKTRTLSAGYAPTPEKPSNLFPELIAGGPYYRPKLPLSGLQSEKKKQKKKRLAKKSTTFLTKVEVN